MLRPVLRWLPALLWMGFIYYWSSQSVLPIDGNDYTALLHRLAHLGAYGLLALLLTLATGTDRRGRLTAFVIAVLYGISDEIHQMATPGRMGQVRDVAIDTAAAALAMAGLPYLIRFVPPPRGSAARPPGATAGKPPRHSRGNGR